MLGVKADEYTPVPLTIANGATKNPLPADIMLIPTILPSTITGSITGLIYDTFTGDGSTVNYTLSTTPTTKYFTLVTIGGVVQNKTNYSVKKLLTL